MGLFSRSLPWQDLASSLTVRKDKGEEAAWACAAKAAERRATVKALDSIIEIFLSKMDGDNRFKNE